VDPHPIEIMTSRGAVRGSQQGGVSAFLGIPYAEPLAESRRFDAPTRARAWDGVFEADEFGPRPPQYPFPGRPMPVPTDGHHLDGQYLTVDVWTPAASGTGELPVMVWFYGGSFRVGSTADPIHSGATLAGDGDVVVVTVNYRIGAEGYLALEDVPDNRALLDQVLALQWVRDEIGAFGGDPARVTIFGESSGGASVATLMVAPPARGLFCRAIAQSVPGTFFSPELAEDISRELLAPRGLPRTAAAVGALSRAELTVLVRGLELRMPSLRRWGPVSTGPTPFCPVMDGESLPADVWQALARGDARDVELLVGHTRDEWRMFLAMAQQLDGVPPGAVRDAAWMWGPGPRDTAEERQRAAREGISETELFTVLMSDGAFRMPSAHLATAHVRGGGTAFRYELTWASPLYGGALGAGHGLDIALVLGTIADAALYMGEEPPASAYRLSAQMRGVWRRFASTGDPGWAPTGETAWPTRVFDGDDEPHVSEYPEVASRELWAPYPPTTLQLLPPEREVP